MTLMDTEKPAIRLTARHPVTRRKPMYRDWWFEHEGVVFHLSAATRRSTLWTIEPDLDHIEGTAELVEFVRSTAYWMTHAFGLSDARAKLADFIASEAFDALRDAYTALTVMSDYRRAPWDPTSPAEHYKDRRRRYGLDPSPAGVGSTTGPAMTGAGTTATPT